MPRKWYIKSTNGFKGPFRTRVLRRLARDGKMPPNTAISQDGENWFKAKKLAGLEFATPHSQSQTSAKSNKIAFPESLPEQWYVKTKRRVIGPIVTKRLFRWACEGKIPRNAAVSHDRTTWIKAKRVPGIEFTAIASVDLEPQRKPAFATASLPIVQELPIPGPIPRFCDLPLRRADVIQVSLPVIIEIPLFGVLPNLSDIPPRRCDVVAIHLPVVREIPLSGSLPRLVDLPLRRADVVDKKLPVIQELPIVGRVPKIAEIQPPANQQRRAAYFQHFGQLLNINDENRKEDSHVDVCLHPGSPERPFATLVTNGVSDVLIDMPSKKLPKVRAEFVLYVREPDAQHIGILKSLASIVTSGQRGFWYGATMANGDPAKPVFADAVLDGFAFMVSPISTDSKLTNTLALHDEPVQLLWVLPISSAERALITNQGMGSFCELLNRKKCSPLLDPQRRCFATGLNANESTTAGQSLSQNVG